MTAKEFWEKFDKQVKLNADALKKVWDSPTRFTSEIKKTIKMAIKEKHNDAISYDKEDNYGFGDYVIQPEYFNIDLVAWEQKKDSDYYNVEDGIKGYQLLKYAWDFDIAIEHENDKYLWADEVIKLAYIYCKLRVVIGYFPYIGEDKKYKTQLEYLNEIAKVLNNLGCKENMKCGEFMIILGDVGGKKSCGFEKIKYTPYVYNGEEFMRME